VPTYTRTKPLVPHTRAGDDSRGHAHSPLYSSDCKRGGSCGDEPRALNGQHTSRGAERTGHGALAQLAADCGRGGAVYGCTGAFVGVCMFMVLGACPYRLWFLHRCVSGRVYVHGFRCLFILSMVFAQVRLWVWMFGLDVIHTLCYVDLALVQLADECRWG